MLGRRPAATSSRSDASSSAVPPASVSDTVNRPSACRTEPIDAPASTWMPSAAIARATTSEDSGSSRARMRGAASTSETLVPNRANACASSAPIAPPPMTTMRRRQVGRARGCRGWSRTGCRPGRRPGGAAGRGAGVEHDPARRRRSAMPSDLDHAGADEPRRGRARTGHRPSRGARRRRVSSQSSVASSRIRACTTPQSGATSAAPARVPTRRASASRFAARITILRGCSRSRGTRRRRGARRCRRRSGRPSRPRWRGARHRARGR